MEASTSLQSLLDVEVDVVIDAVDVPDCRSAREPAVDAEIRHIGRAARAREDGRLAARASLERHAEKGRLRPAIDVHLIDT